MNTNGRLTDHIVVEIIKSPSFYLNTYTPLARSAAGRETSVRFKMPPFIDGSIRREPDLEHKWPSISCLCRADKFAPRMRVGDYVAYMTCTGPWHKDSEARPSIHRRLAAILCVHTILQDHEGAASWYRRRGLGLPSNCIVPGNPRKALEESHRMTRFRCVMSDGKLHGTWDKAYQRRAKKYPLFLICKPVFRSLGWDAPKVNDADLKHVFRKLPGTQNPGGQPTGLHAVFVIALQWRATAWPCTGFRDEVI